DREGARARDPGARAARGEAQAPEGQDRVLDDHGDLRAARGDAPGDAHPAPVPVALGARSPEPALAGGGEMMRRSSMLALALVLLSSAAACGRPFDVKTAPGFVELENQTTYAYRATTP